MAICYWDAKVLWEARWRGVSFAKTATIGHLSLHLHRTELAYFRHAYSSKFPQSIAEPLAHYSFGGYSDDFLTGYLGVVDQTILDASAYEGADTVHDLNLPIPERLREAFDVVIDNGSLEHIFNFPIAIGNLMNMVKVGGSLFISTPANNLCGHGFFQFSPELMFRVFTEANGFELQRVLLTEALFPSVEMSAHRDAFEVVDPEMVKSRVGLISSGPVTMLVEARKVAAKQIFSKYPLQSDYVNLWKSDENRKPETSVRKKILQRVFQSLPLEFQLRLSGLRQKKSFSFANQKHFKKIG